MKRPILLLLSLTTMASVQLLSAPSKAQTEDFVSKVGDRSFDSQEQFKWVNQAQCDDSATQVEVTIGGTGSVTEVFVWVGGDAANCDTRESRVGANPTCSQVGNGSFLVDDNSITFALDLLEGDGNGRVDCQSSSVQGTDYRLFNFRRDPGDDDVPPTEYGTAPFTVDVESPQAVAITSDSELTGSQFTISWERPTESEFLEEYLFYQNEIDDSESATVVEGVSANGTDRSVTLSANDLGLQVGESNFVFVQAVDMALNKGELSSPGVQVTAVDSGGYCDQRDVECGCSASAVSSGSAQRSLSAFVMLLLAAVLLLRRRFIR